jgi:uncharacterized protein with PIN domain
MPTKRANKGQWNNLARDEKGRWIKREGSVTSKKIKKSSSSVKDNSLSEQNITQVITEIQSDFIENCPRCGGNMRKRPIRCGPERVIDVKQCFICNFYIPIR